MASHARFGLVVMAALALAACGGRRGGGGGGNPDLGGGGGGDAGGDGSMPMMDGSSGGDAGDGGVPGDDLGFDGGKPPPGDLGIDMFIPPPIDFGVDFGVDASRPDMGRDLGFDMGRDLGTDMGRDFGTDFGTSSCTFTRLTCSSGTVHATTTSPGVVTNWADCSGGTGYDRDDFVWTFIAATSGTVTISSVETGGLGLDYDLFAVSTTSCDGSGVCLGASRGTTGDESISFSVTAGEQVLVGYDRYDSIAGPVGVDLTISCF